jgi:hypothetical protein
MDAGRCSLIENEFGLKAQNAATGDHRVVWNCTVWVLLYKWFKKTEQLQKRME